MTALKFCIYIALGFASFSIFARDNLSIVGSSTVFPFASQVVERFAYISSLKSPVLESTGSGGGLKIFCSGIGENYPDIVNTSRRIVLSELKKCKDKGITLTEFKIGSDGVVIAHNIELSGFNFSQALIFIALAEDNGFDYKPTTWKEAWDTLPEELQAEIPAPADHPIHVYGPPSTSGTRDAFIELIMEKGAKKLAPYLNWDKKTYKNKSKTIRTDEAYINAGENDNLIIQKIRTNTKAFGIFGFYTLENNYDSVKGVKINGIAPEFESILSKDYPLARELFFYVKRNHKDVIPGLLDYVKTFLSEEAIGEYGYLVEKGLIPLTEEEQKNQFEKINLLPELTEDELKSGEH